MGPCLQLRLHPEPLQDPPHTCEGLLVQPIYSFEGSEQGQWCCATHWPSDRAGMTGQAWKGQQPATMDGAT